MILFLIITIASLCEWSIVWIFFNHVTDGIRLRRIFRPVFMIESSQLMKKTIKAANSNGLKIIAYAKFMEYSLNTC